MSFGGPSEPQYTPPPAQQPQYSQQQYAQSPYTPPQFSQQPVYASALAQPTPYSPPAPAAPAPAGALPMLPVPSKKGRTVSIWLFGVLGFALVALIGYFVWALGAVASGMGLVLALIPLAIVFLGVYIIDRWEPEPKLLIVFAIAWGGVAAVGLTLLVDIGITLMVGLRSEVFSAVIQAPIIEELAKGLGIFIIFLIGRRAFDGPIDGIVYGALIGGGFAFTENIQYFAISLIEGGGEQLTATFVMRGLLSPFAHAMFTALTGFAMGLAARRTSSKGAVLGAGLLGLLGAMILHGFWNGSAMFADFFALYITLQVPLFIGFILAIVALRKEEARITRERLGDYAAAGWFTPEEITMLATPAGRKVGLRWAASLRGDRRPLMKTFIKDAAALAAVRQRAIAGRDPLAADDERALLTRTRATRAALLAY
ncbi:PrsW family intramembrane metalloprotease [Microbacterium murale]|uniref:RsiW-degrading membrane proteinase PrsW (M82 family) n=1 Tax=Microbacterium murale TaxID=1081040 RepID=A0ABU0PDW5_9MICO|nr:PrsW family intramembrane metalloprotease [Microbacterium murale]MDQ0645222.1 RsiW-degrading membrane proteinase PrsW (M82 family) [Microbacterium murale]